MVTQNLTDKLKEKIIWLPGFMDIERVNHSRNEAFNVIFKPMYWNTLSSEKSTFSLSQEGTKGLALASDFTRELTQGNYKPKPADNVSLDYNKFPYALTEGGFTFGIPDGRIWFDYYQKSGRVYHPSIRINYVDERLPKTAQLVSDKGVKFLEELNQFGKKLPNYFSLNFFNGISLYGNVPAEKISECAEICREMRTILDN